MLNIGPVATLYMKGRPSGDSLDLFYDFKFATEGEPYENVLFWNGRASSKHCDAGIELKELTTATAIQIGLKQSQQNKVNKRRIDEH
jgi:hypothetical protein